MKILLPVAALGLLSTLFLLSRPVDPTQSVPYIEGGVEQRAQDQGMSRPAFAGVTDNGDQISFRALTARPDPDNEDMIVSDDVTAQIRLTTGTIIDVNAATAHVNQVDDWVTMTGDVVITSSKGYELRTQKLTSQLNTVQAETDGPVEGTGPAGTLSAGRMVLSTNPETDQAQLLFTDGVKLVYTPQQTKD